MLYIYIYTHNTLSPMIHIYIILYSVEMKVVEGLFYYCHGSQIPSGFNYGNYVGYLYSQYLAEVRMIYCTCMYI